MLTTDHTYPIDQKQLYIVVSVTGYILYENN